MQALPEGKRRRPEAVGRQCPAGSRRYRAECPFDSMRKEIECEEEMECEKKRNAKKGNSGGTADFLQKARPEPFQAWGVFAFVPGS